MYAKHQSQHADTADRADVATMLLEANEAYRDSNTSHWSLKMRLEARSECQRLAEQALVALPEQPAALGLLGRVAFDNGDMDQAYDFFNRSLEADDQQSQQYANLGYWALTTDQPVLAEQYFLEALELDRQSATAFCGVAHAKRAQGQFDSAYLHYRKLLELGHDWSSVYSGMLECAGHLVIHTVNPEFIQDAIALLRRDELPHQQIGRFVGSILRVRYDLDNPQAQVSLEEASQDELLLLALERTLMPDPQVELLITLLRHTILAEVAETATLREELQGLASAIALYADRTGYALLAGENESAVVQAINTSISAQFAMHESLTDVAGSLMISAMYGALFHQAFSVNIGQWNLTEWPTELQLLMSASYYNRATEEAIKQNFEEKIEELAVDPMDIAQAWPTWNQLSSHPANSMKALIKSRLRLDTDALPETLRVMICGTESGQRALELAASLDDVEIIAVDESLSNIARATRTAEELGMENIVFWPWSLASRFIADGHKVQWIEIGRLPSEKMERVSLAALVNDACEQGAVVHLNTGPTEQLEADRHIQQLIDQHGLPKTNATLRRLRRMVMNNAQEPGWSTLLSDADFYGLGGCHSRWFHPQDFGQLRDLVGLMCNEVDWKLVRAQDTDGHALALAPVQRQLQAEATGSDVQSVMGQPLTLYFMKRR